MRTSKKGHMRARTVIGIALVASGAAAAAIGCQNAHEKAAGETSGKLGASGSVRDLMTARGLNEADVEAALKTYVPSG